MCLMICKKLSFKSHADGRACMMKQAFSSVTKKKYDYSLYNTTIMLGDVELTDNCGVDRAHFLLTISTIP